MGVIPKGPCKPSSKAGAPTPVGKVCPRQRQQWWRFRLGDRSSLVGGGVLPAAGRIRRPGQLTDPEVSERFALENFPDYYHEFGGLLDWYNPWDAVLESTSDGYWRAGKWIDHKEKADQARDLAVGEDHRVEKVLIWERHRGQYRSEHALVEGRDVVVDDVIGEFRGQRVEPEHMRADETLFLVYTSGSTGKPRRPGIPPVATSPTVTAMSKLILDLKPTDVYWCMADIGWITGSPTTGGCAPHSGPYPPGLSRCTS